MVGTIIVLKAVLGSSVAIITTTNAEFKGLSDKFLLVVGLVFIHGVDEQFGYMQGIIEQTREKNNYYRVTLQFGYFWWFLFLPLNWCFVFFYEFCISLDRDYLIDALYYPL